MEKADEDFLGVLAPFAASPHSPCTFPESDRRSK